MSASRLKGTATSVLPGLFSGGPEQPLLPLVLCKLKVAALVGRGDLLHQLDLLPDAGFGARELEEERGLFDPDAGRGEATEVDDSHLHLVHDLEALHGDGGLHDCRGSRCGVADAGEVDDGHGRLLWDDGELECSYDLEKILALTLSDDSERALGAHKQTVEIVSRGRLARSPARLDDLPVRQDNSQVDDPVLHGAVSHGIGSGAVGANHASNLGGRAWSVQIKE
ncbi:hypothetical protein Trco_003697 [Trichoderma cornu-damae]|uniref:Uncharacterized protein n=1 Tax=Trichoderma cornu-damae TaxID=654480 RepID=A0A9P8TW80_9HYPO|nr:hypothetical protein Trco_003697 [Trichoderma cornu-damae]